MDKLESEDRVKWQDPAVVLGCLGLKRGETLMDVGCGPGYFTIPASAIVGEEGRVYAVDISLEMLMRLGQRLYTQGIVNVTPILSRETNIPLPDGCGDAALLANVLHEAEDPVALLAEVRRLLRTGGRLLVVDWQKAETPFGPPANERLGMEEAKAFAHRAGFPEGSSCAVGPYHWGLLLRKQG